MNVLLVDGCTLAAGSLALHATEVRGGPMTADCTAGSESWSGSTVAEVVKLFVSVGAHTPSRQSLNGLLG